MKLPTQSQRRLAWLTGLAAVAALALAANWVARKEHREVQPSSPLGEVGPSKTGDPSAGPGVGAPASLYSAINLARQGCERDATGARRHLEELRRVLRQSPTPEASAAIREFLSTKADAATGLGLKVGSDGVLAGAPTLRIFLLDQLGQIDPAGAAASGRAILDSMGSSDEWAVALRNCALGDAGAEGRTFVGEKLQAMLTYEPWLNNPSAGFLEAFDVAVHLGGTNLIPTLTGIVRMKENAAASHAAYLALDRLTIADAASTLAHLQANPELMAGREITRARERQLIEAYLLNPRLDLAELDKFAGLYPNANFMVSHNLLTGSATPDHAGLTARDAEALRLVRQWLSEPRFAHRQPQLQAIQRRLEAFARQTGAP